MHFGSRFLILCIAICCLMVIGITQFAYANSDSQAPTDIAATSATELVMFEVNRPVTTDDRGFPKEDPPRSSANGDWTKPINFAEGTLHYRVEIRNQPRPQNMRIQFCIWQYQFRLENCGALKNVSGASGTVVTWSDAVQDLWRLNGNIIDWVNPRQRYGIAIKNMAGLPVSNYNGWNWNGEDPSKWYPIDMRFTVVVVAKGAVFSGWDNYIGGRQTPTPTRTPPTATPTPGLTRTPALTPTPTSPCNPATLNLLQNGDFEQNLDRWRFYTNGQGDASRGAPGYSCAHAVRIAISQISGNTQFYQKEIRLEADTRYRLRFAAYSHSGRDLGVYLHKHGAPYSNYGLAVVQANLTTSWQTFSVEFATHGFAGSIQDARLRFWLGHLPQPGDVYWLDNVRLEKVSAQTSDDETIEGMITATENGLLLGLTPEEVDPNALIDLSLGDVVDEESNKQQMFLPIVVQ